MSVFMKFPGIRGAVSDAQHQGWISVVDMRFGVKRRISSCASTQYDRESANAEITDLTVYRAMDIATPYLFIESCCGKGKDGVAIHLTETGKGAGNEVFMSYMLGNVLISDYEVAAVGQADTRPTELITLSFVDIEVRYTPHDQNGRALASISVGFNTATNEKR